MDVRVPDHARRVELDPADPAEAAEDRHLPEEVVRENREGQREHEEVDPEASARERSQDEPDEGRDDDR